MRLYADLKVQANCHVELRQDKVTHFYSVPYIHVGKQARVVFTRSWVKAYVEQKLVASHIRSHTYGYTTVREHLASSCRVIMERSAAYYVEKAKDISPDCHEYVKRIFDPKRTTQPEEVYYKLCNSIVSLRRKYDLATFDLTCRQCMEYGIYSYSKFEAILRRNGMNASADETVIFHAPTPSKRTLHELKLPGMASCWSSLEETHQLDKLTLREGMQIMLQYERDTRGNNRIQRLIKNAGFRLRASMEELETDTARGIQACSAADLATGNYITGGMTVIITGPAGTGKSYFACALGDRACRNGRKVLYFTMNMTLNRS